MDLRDRLDFSVISKIILDNRKIGAMSQVEYYFCLFQYAFLLTETAPSITKCANLLKGIFENCIVYGMDVPYYNALLNTIESIYRNITLDDAVSATMFMTL